MSKRMTTHPLRQMRRESAAKLTEERAQRTPIQQLAKLDKLLGAGKGAQKERARLIALVRGDQEKAKAEKLARETAEKAAREAELQAEIAKAQKAAQRDIEAEEKAAKRGKRRGK